MYITGIDRTRFGVLNKSIPEKISVGVVGTGTMGTGIAYVMIEAGFNVIVKTRSEYSLNKSRKKIEKLLLKTHDENEANKILDNIKFTFDMSSLNTADIIFECIVEEMEIKKQLFKELGEICPEDVILASDTSSLSITEFSSVVTNPERVVGVHFFNPVQKMQLVEIIRGRKTSDQTIEYVKKIASQLGKTYIITADTPGFIVNRMLMPLINEAIHILEEGNATAKDIDTAVKLGLNHPMGPLELADFIGLDVCVAIMGRLYDGLNDNKYKPRTLLLILVKQGNLGRKTGKGFYSYP